MSFRIKALMPIIIEEKVEVFEILSEIARTRANTNGFSIIFSEENERLLVKLSVKEQYTNALRVSYSDYKFSVVILNENFSSGKFKEIEFIAGLAREIEDITAEYNSWDVKN